MSLSAGARLKASSSLEGGNDNMLITGGVDGTDQPLKSGEVWRKVNGEH